MSSPDMTSITPGYLATALQEIGARFKGGHSLDGSASDVAVIHEC